MKPKRNAVEEIRKKFRCVKCYEPASKFKFGKAMCSTHYAKLNESLCFLK